MSETSPKEKPFFKSKKFWTATLTGVFLVMNDVMDLGLTEGTVTYLTGLAMVYLTSTGLADFGKYQVKHETTS